MKGWHRVPRSKPVRYRNPSGKIVTRSAYDNERAKRAGFRNYYGYRKARKSSDFIRWEKDAISKRGFTRKDFTLESEFVRKFQKGTSTWDKKSPKGPLADFLVYIGAREPDWEWNVGDTPQAPRK